MRGEPRNHSLKAPSSALVLLHVELKGSGGGAHAPGQLVGIAVEGLRVGEMGRMCPCALEGMCACVVHELWARLTR